MDQRRLHERSAPRYSIPSRQIISVEHPGVVKNIDKGIETLQGDAGISKLLNPPQIGAPASLSLRTEDATSRPLGSINTATNNVLLRVVVPKRTGRKRKRGSSDEFTDTPTTESSSDRGARDASHLQRILQDNVGRYKVETIGTVGRTHVFRGMPDFVFSTTASPFATKFRENIFPFKYEKLKQFRLDMSKGATSNVDIIPPPTFSYNDMPFNYIYRQTATIKLSIDQSGSVTTINTQRLFKICTHLVSYDVPVVPSDLREDCPPLSTTDQTMKDTVELLHQLFADRPIWTRRGLRNSIPSPDQRYLLRSALAYVGYTFRSGPWRDAIIKFSHDPRKSPESRIYQTLTFHILPPEGDSDPAGSGTGGTNDTTSHGRHQRFPSVNYEYANPTTTKPTDPENQTPTHLFTGSPPLPRDGKMWMICDITDPILTNLLSTPTIRTVCDPLTDGWYGNLTLAKTRAIMRSKIQTLLSGNMPRDEDFRRILEFPEHAISEEEVKRVVSFGPGDGVGSKEIGLAAEVRAAVRTAPGRIKVGGKGWGRLDEGVNVGIGVGGGDGDGADEEEEGVVHDYDEQDAFEGVGVSNDGAKAGDRGENVGEGEVEGEGEDEAEEVNEEDDDDENEDSMDITPG